MHGAGMATCTGTAMATARACSSQADPRPPRSRLSCRSVRLFKLRQRLGGQLPLGADPTLDKKAQRSLSAPLKPQRDARFVLAMHATI